MLPNAILKIIQIIADYSRLQKRGGLSYTFEEFPDNDYRKTEFYGSIYRFMKLEGKDDSPLRSLVETPALLAHEKKGLLHFLKHKHPQQMEETLVALNDSLLAKKKKTTFADRVKRWRETRFAKIWRWLRIPVYLYLGVALVGFSSSPAFQNNSVKIVGLSLLLIMTLANLYDIFPSKAERIWKLRPGSALEISKTLEKMEQNALKRDFRIGKFLLATLAVIGMFLIGLPQFDFSYDGRMLIYAQSDNRGAYLTGARHIVNSGPVDAGEKLSVMEDVYLRADPDDRLSLCLMAAHMHNNGKDHGLGKAFLDKYLHPALTAVDASQISTGQIKTIPSLVTCCDSSMLVDVYAFIYRCGLEENEQIAASFHEKIRTFTEAELIQSVSLMKEKNIDPYGYFALYTTGKSEEQILKMIDSTEDPSLKKAILLGVSAKCNTPEQIISLVNYGLANDMSLVDIIKPEKLSILMVDWDWQKAKEFITSIPKANGQIIAIQAYGLQLTGVNDVLALIHNAYDIGGYTPVECYPHGAVIDLKTAHFDVLSEYPGDLGGNYTTRPYLIIRRFETPDPLQYFPLNKEFADEQTMLAHPSPIADYYDGNAELGDAAYTVTLDTEMMSFFPMDRIPRTYEECSFVVSMDRFYYMCGGYRFYSRNYLNGVPSSDFIDVKDYPTYGCFSGISMYDIKTGGCIGIFESSAFDWDEQKMQGAHQGNMLQLLKLHYLTKPNTAYEEQIRLRFLHHVKNSSGDIFTIINQYP